MIVDFIFRWVQDGGPGEGAPSVYRFTVDDSVREAYAKMGKPHGDTDKGLAEFVRHTVTAAVSSGQKGGVYKLFGDVGKFPGYKPMIEVAIVGNSEEDIAPPGALGPYRGDPIVAWDVKKIREVAEEEEGQKIAYLGITCKFWAVRAEDCAPCPGGGDHYHCPYCGGLLLAGELDDYLADLPLPIQAAVLSAYAGNCEECHPSIEDYMGDAVNRIGDALKVQASLRAQATEGPGRYAHLMPKAQALAARTCPTCGGDAVPVACMAEGADGDQKWLLTWLCNDRHYNHKAPTWIAPWPFAEELATAADLAVAGFKVIQ